MTDQTIVPIKPRQMSGMHRCSGHAACKGPSLRQDHDAVCDAGAECDSEFCWQPCEFCVPDEPRSESEKFAGYMEYLARVSVELHGNGWEASARACLKEAAEKLRSTANASSE